MKNKLIILSLATLFIVWGCKKQTSADADVIDKPNIEVKEGKLSPEVLWSFGRIGETRELKMSYEWLSLSKPCIHYSETISK